MRHVVSLMLVLVAVIHLTPLTGVLGPDRLAALYGLGFDEPNLSLLMRHRAVLFGMVGTLLLLSVVMPALRGAAFLVGFASLVSFLLLAWAGGPYNDSVARVVTVDVAALAFLCIGLGAHVLMRRQRG